MSLNKQNDSIQHIFIIGSKSIGQYGGYETFVDKLTEQHQNDLSIKYHIACKANGEGFMDESKLSGVEIIKRDNNGNSIEFFYHNAHVFKIKCPNIGPAVALYYDCKSIMYCIEYCKKNNIYKPIFYVLTCRIGLFINPLVRKIKSIGGVYYLNPDGHEWLRAKWSLPIRKYWKWSERIMVNASDLVICDSVNIEKYIIDKYKHKHTCYISYGADVTPSSLNNENPIFREWLNKNNIKIKNYYIVVGRFVPENNYETMIKEFMISKTSKDFVLITNINDKFLAQLEEKLHWKNDKRIKFVGTVYDQQLLKKIRECAFGYLHGHEVGGTNPSLLEALGSTNLNLLLDVGFNKEVGQDCALYWSKQEGDLSNLINRVDKIPDDEIKKYGLMAKNRIINTYSWKYIAKEYKNIWLNYDNN